jgi:hypothetical protein
MANEISFTLGISVTNGLFQSIPVPTQNIPINQTNPGVGGLIIVVAPGGGYTASFAPASVVSTPGVTWMQNVSANGAVVTVASSSASPAQVIAVLAPGQFVVIPQGGVAVASFEFSTPTSTAIMDCQVLNA